MPVAPDAAAAAVAEPAPQPVGAGLAPLRADQRIAILDALRGFALVGVFAVNFPVLTGARFDAHPPARPDVVVSTVLDLAVIGRFLSVLSFLFGLGFSLQLARADATRAGLAPYLRRIGALFLIGVAHATLIWFGDILMIYAVLGLVLVAFRRSSDRALLVAAAVAVLVRPLLLVVMAVVATHHGKSPIAEAWATITGGSRLDVIALNVRILTAMFTGPMAVWDLSLLAPMLFGAYVGRRGYLSDLDRHRAFLPRLVGWGAIAGVAGSAVVIALTLRGGARPGPALAVLHESAHELAELGLAALYLGGFVYAWRSAAARRALGALAPMGRACLSCYLLHTLFATTVFYGWSRLGIAGGVGVAASVACALGFYVLALVAARAWLRRHRFGPVEWAWRAVTYGRAPS